MTIISMNNSTSTGLIQLKIKLKDSKPPIWRRILVNNDIAFSYLHNIIQIVMGWENYHLYSFNFKGFTIGEDDPEFDDFFGKDNKLNADNTPLSEILLKVKQKFIYEYDFGDGWEHELIVEKFLPLNKKIPVAKCLKGVKACPPEDCGGIWGYYNLLEAINDKKHPEHNDVLEWIGEEYDTEYFNLKEVNLELSELN